MPLPQPCLESIDETPLGWAEPSPDPDRQRARRVCTSPTSRSLTPPGSSASQPGPRLSSRRRKTRSGAMRAWDPPVERVEPRAVAARAERCGAAGAGRRRSPGEFTGAVIGRGSAAPSRPPKSSPAREAASGWSASSCRSEPGRGPGGRGGSAPRPRVGPGREVTSSPTRRVRRAARRARAPVGCAGAALRRSSGSAVSPTHAGGGGSRRASRSLLSALAGAVARRERVSKVGGQRGAHGVTTDSRGLAGVGIVRAGGRRRIARRLPAMAHDVAEDEAQDDADDDEARSACVMSLIHVL